VPKGGLARAWLLPFVGVLHALLSSLLYLSDCMVVCCCPTVMLSVLGCFPYSCAGYLWYLARKMQVSLFNDLVM